MRFYKPFAFFLTAALLQGCVSRTYNVTTREEEIIFISSEKEEQIGRQLAEQIAKKFELDPDPLAQKRVQDIGKKIADVCDRKSIPYRFAVLVDDKDTVNAFALPGGYVFIFKAMLDKMENDDELACVLAHEVAHIAARHSIKRAQGSLGDAVLRLAIAMSRTETDRVTHARINEALNQLMLSYSREDEMLADRLAVKYATSAGYNPEGAITFLERLMEIQRKAPIKRYYRYRSHPYLSERLSVVREAVHGRMEFRDYINLRDESLPSKKE